MRLLLLLISFTLYISSNESCLNCHNNTTDIDEFHKVKDFGCAICHGGDKKATTKQKAHKGIVLNPARLEHAKIFCAKCHSDIVNRVSKSIMNTQSGILDVLKFQFKETKTIKKSSGIESLKNKNNLSLAEDHFSKLCAPCHINQDEKVFKSLPKRGGGCIDCHREPKDENISYAHLTKASSVEQRVKSKKAKSQKLKAKSYGKGVFIHPKMTTKIPSSNCLKCHNRSNRIGLSYFGKFESEGYGTPYKDGKLTHKIDKNRFFYELPADIHHTKANLDCIDCHSEVGVMGDGKEHLHMEGAVDISCNDCHNPTFKSAKNYPKASLLAFLNGNIPIPKTIAVTKKKDTPLYNIQKDGSKIALYRKKDGKKFFITKLSANSYHTQDFHKRLDCTACHSAWIPSCYGCHEVYFKDGKQYDWIKAKKTKGAWMELRSYLRYESPTLAIGYNKKIMPTAPGCQVLMNIYDKNGSFSQPFHSFAYGAWDPHTTSKKSRECIDCHFNPLTIGLGNGVLKFENSKIKFMPFFDSNRSGLPISYPIDALISKDGKQFQSFSRNSARGFNKDEVKKIVNAYKCIICHSSYSDKIYKDFNKSKELFFNKKSKCSKELLKGN